MVSEVEIKSNYRKDRGGWVIYLPRKLIEDSSFPLKTKDKLIAEVDGKKLTIRKA